jgi:hypothetical protein
MICVNMKIQVYILEIIQLESKKKMICVNLTFQVYYFKLHII